MPIAAPPSVLFYVFLHLSFDIFLNVIFQQENHVEVGLSENFRFIYLFSLTDFETSNRKISNGSVRLPVPFIFGLFSG